MLNRLLGARVSTILSNQSAELAWTSKHDTYDSMTKLS